MKELLLINPIISYTPTIDFFLSILESHNLNTRSWIFENYIDLVINADSNGPVFEFLDVFKVWWNCPFIHTSRIHRDAFMIMANNQLSKDIENFIDKEYYVSSLVDTFYIDKYPAYENEHIYHQLMIYGYDGINFLCSDYIGSIRKKFLVEYAQMEFALKSVPDMNDYLQGILLYRKLPINKTGLIEIDFLLYRSEYVFDFELTMMKIKNFLYGNQNVLLGIPNLFSPSNNFVAGFPAIEEFSTQISGNNPDNPYLILKYFHLIYSHVFLMCERFKFINENRHNFKKYYHSCMMVLKKALTLRNVVTKMNLYSRYDIAKIAQFLSEFIKDYRYLLKDVVERQT